VHTFSTSAKRLCEGIAGIASYEDCRDLFVRKKRCSRAAVPADDSQATVPQYSPVLVKGSERAGRRVGKPGTWRPLRQELGARGQLAGVADHVHAGLANQLRSPPYHRNIPRRLAVDSLPMDYLPCLSDERMARIQIVHQMR